MSLESVRDVLAESGLAIALTGAGVSVESGIPDFRSAGGIWEKYPPELYATIGGFRENPERFWKVQPFQSSDVEMIQDILVNLSMDPPPDPQLFQQTVAIHWVRVQ